MIERLRVQIPAGVVGELSSPESTLCADSYSLSVHPHVTAVARKRLQPFCQKCRWQVTAKQAEPLTQRSRSGLTMPLSRHSVGTYPETRK